ncbi:MAG: hypothetical protein ABIO44_06220 [Saprospiraceae bacterium]
MTLHIFNCSSRQTRTGLTPDNTGNNLPATECQGTWTYLKTIDNNPGEIGRIGASPYDEILAAIARDGYYINDSTIQITEREQ